MKSNSTRPVSLDVEGRLFAAAFNILLGYYISISEMLQGKAEKERIDPKPP